MSPSRRILLAVVGHVFLLNWEAMAQALHASLDNGTVKVGVSRDYGGAIVWLSTSGGGNLVNNFDKGRQVQQSYYAGSSITGPDQCANWSPWPWNPIMVGDCAGNTSPVLTLSNSVGQIYVKTQPMLWDRNNYLAQAHIEQWISFHPACSNVVVVDNQLTCFRDNNDAWGNSALLDQELPACYFVSCLDTIKSYTGSSPWQNQALDTIPNNSSNSFPWTRYTPTEKWSACVNASGFGAGVYSPIATSSAAGKALTGSTCRSYDAATMYIGPNGQQRLDRHTVFTYRYYLMVGTLSAIRLAVYELHSPGTTPPSITTPPQSQTVPWGVSATFNVTAFGSPPLSYQWRFNSNSIAGATASSYTRSSVQPADGGDYLVVVTNSAGTITSAPAKLTVITRCAPDNLVNADFEGGNAGGVATGWAGYQRTEDPTPATVWSIQTNDSREGGLQYQQIAITNTIGGGGVRQNITGCTIGATYTITGWMGGNHNGVTSTVKCSPSASTNWATAIDLDPPQTYTGPYWTPFSGTAVATGTNMTLWLDGQTGWSGLNQAVRFDSVTVICASAPAPFRFETAAWLPEKQARLVLSGPPGSSTRILRSSNLVNWLTLTNLVNTNGMLEFTDTMTTNTPLQFYRAMLP